MEEKILCDCSLHYLYNDFILIDRYFNAQNYWQRSEKEKEVIMEDKGLKKRLKKIPDADKNGDPIYKIDNAKNESGKEKDKPTNKDDKN